MDLHMPTAKEIINERQATHGSYDENARIAQATKDLWRSGRNWSALTPRQRESLELIATKVGRILAGDPDCPDHWKDIAGYFTLGAE